MHPGLSRLSRLRLRGSLRVQWKRLRTLKGFLGALVLGLLVSTWILGILLQEGTHLAGLDRESQKGMASLLLGGFLVIALVNGIAHRGVYLPPEECDRLLAAPITRADLVRYRLRGMLQKTLPFALLLGLLASRHMPAPHLAWLPSALGILVLPIAAQALALVLAAEGGWAGAMAARIPLSLLRLAILPVALGIPLLLVDFTEYAPLQFGGDGAVSKWLAAPWLPWVVLPLWPITEAMIAPDLGSLLPWLAASGGLLLLGFEATARLPVDFRAATLDTSRELTARLQQVRSGGMAAMGTDRGAARRGMPRWAGHGPAGAVLWLRSIELLRRAGRVVGVAAMQLTLSLLIGVFLFPEVERGGVLVLGLATFQLSTTIRGDLRGDLDRIESVKGWPLAAHHTFLASILPGSLLVGGLVASTLILRGALTGGLTSLDFLLACAAPALALTWAAVENLVFLLRPVRLAPGDATASHGVSRIAMQTVANLLLVGVVVAPAVLAYVFTLVWLGDGALAEGVAWLVASLLGFALLGALVLLGGWALRRLDPSLAHA